MSYTWLLVGSPIVCEISAAIGLRFSNGFSKPVPTVLAVTSFGLAFYLISLSLMHLPVSTVYSIWAGGRTAGVAVVGIIVLKEQASLMKGIGVSLVVAGMVLLNVSSVPGP
jgi:small multidrug resistance pump